MPTQGGIYVLGDMGARRRQKDEGVRDSGDQAGDFGDKRRLAVREAEEGRMLVGTVGADEVGVGSGSKGAAWWFVKLEGQSDRGGELVGVQFVDGGLGGREPDRRAVTKAATAAGDEGVTVERPDFMPAAAAGPVGAGVCAGLAARRAQKGVGPAEVRPHQNLPLGEDRRGRGKGTEAMPQAGLHGRPHCWR